MVYSSKLEINSRKKIDMNFLLNLVRQMGGWSNPLCTMEMDFMKIALTRLAKQMFSRTWKMAVSRLPQPRFIVRINEQKLGLTCPKKTHFSIEYLCETHVSGFRYLFCHYPLWNMTKQKLTNSKKKYCLFRTLIILNDISIHHSFFKAICIHKYSCPLKKSYFRNKDK